MKLNRFADIQNHEAKCIFSQTHCNQPGCIHHNTEKRLDKHVLVCPLEHIRCEVHSFEPGKIIEVIIVISKE